MLPCVALGEQSLAQRLGGRALGCNASEVGRPPFPRAGALTTQSQAQGLEQHNLYRYLHQAPPLKWNGTLARGAQAWANRLAASGCKLQHSGAPGVGENVALSVSPRGSPPSRLSVLQAVDLWYSQGVKGYRWTDKPWTDNKDNRDVGPFQQLLWIATSSVGCGSATGARPPASGGGTCAVVVCRYHKPGNSAASDGVVLANVQPTSFWSPGLPDAQRGLQRVTLYRAAHGRALALAWNATLQRSAQLWASKLASRSCTPQASGAKGESVAARFYGTDVAVEQVKPSLVDAADLWYTVGARTYRFTSRPWSDNRADYGRVGPFTQLLWQSSTSVGCAGAVGSTDDGTCTVVVCHFFRPGNVADDDVTNANVKPRSSATRLPQISEALETDMIAAGAGPVTLAQRGRLLRASPSTAAA